MCAPKPMVKLILKAPQFETAFLSIKNVIEGGIIFSPPLLLSFSTTFSHIGCLLPSKNTHTMLNEQVLCRAIVLRQSCAENIKKAGYEWRETLQII